MHVLSALMGFALPNLIPKAYTHFASAVSTTHRYKFKVFNFSVQLLDIISLFWFEVIERLY